MTSFFYALLYKKGGVLGKYLNELTNDCKICLVSPVNGNGRFVLLTVRHRANPFCISLAKNWRVPVIFWLI